MYCSYGRVRSIYKTKDEEEGIERRRDQDEKELASAPANTRDLSTP